MVSESLLLAQHNFVLKDSILVCKFLYYIPSTEVVPICLKHNKIWSYAEQIWGRPSAMFSNWFCCLVLLLKKVCTGYRLAHTWFLKIVSVRTPAYVCVCMCVCPPPRLLITSGVMWTTYDWLNKFYSSYMATVVITVNGHGLSIDTHRGN